MSSNSIYIVGRYDGIEHKIAECDYGDDAELLFNYYKQAGYACRVVFHGVDDEETLKCEACI